MIPKPTRPCLVCGSFSWWWRETFGPGEWLCGHCHPNPNKDEEESVGEEIELINGKFVVKGKEEVKPKEPVVIKQYSEEVIVLRDRVIRGNQKLFDAWLKIREITHNTEEWSREMDRWSAAWNKLHLLCVELKARGYTDCLYIVDGKRVKNCLKNPNGFWCQVCPSIYPYWEKELMNLPSGSGKIKEERE